MSAPSGEPRLSLPRKVLRLNWALILLVGAIAGIGFLLLYSVAGGSFDPWASRQAIRFGIGMALMLVVAMIDIRFWRRISPIAYLGGAGLLVAVEFFGASGGGAQRWLQLGPLRLQPSELMKIGLVMALAHYYATLDRDRISRPLWILPPLALIAIPVLLVLRQPDLGTALLLAVGGASVMFLAGVGWRWWTAAMVLGVSATFFVLESKGTEYQVLKDYQYKRIEIFLDPETAPLGEGYHIIQSKIAFGSGGISGRGFMQGPQSRLNFLPEKHTDFIFTSLAEDFGFIGSLSFLSLYVLVLLFCFTSMAHNRDRYGALLTGGLAGMFFFYWATNMAMVMGLIPVVGVPLPLVSYGGSAMLTLLFAFGLIQSAHVHRRA